MFVREKFHHGGQFGNNNALRVGLYARNLLALSNIPADSTPDTPLDDEATLLYILLVRASQAYEDHPPMTVRQELRALNLFYYALETINKLRQTHRLKSALPDLARLVQIFTGITPDPPPGE